MTSNLLQGKLIAFAQSHEHIIAVTKGVDPANQSRKPYVMYYFMVNGAYNFELDNAITALDMQLAEEGFDGGVSQCCYVNLRKNPEGFLGEYIWERQL